MRGVYSNPPCHISGGRRVQLMNGAQKVRVARSPRQEVKTNGHAMKTNKIPRKSNEESKKPAGL